MTKQLLTAREMSLKTRGPRYQSRMLKVTIMFGSGLVIAMEKYYLPIILCFILSVNLFFYYLLNIGFFYYWRENKNSEHITQQNRKIRKILSTSPRP